MGATCTREPVIKASKPPPKQLKTISEFSKVSDYKKKYEFISIIGNGVFGKVRLFRDKVNKELKVAIKTIKKENISYVQTKCIIDEVKILRDLDHPNIVKYFETYEDNYYINIVMEYIPGEDLFKVITMRKIQIFTEADAAEIMSCLLKAVLFLHKMKIVHRDIKPENILFSIPGNYQSLKLIDFGLSTYNINNYKQRVGSPLYMSPEIIKGNYNDKTDLWSIGVILFQMMTGNNPFNGNSEEEVFKKITEGDFNKRLLDQSKASADVKDLIKNLLVKDPKKRFSCMDALSHSWFTKFNSNKETTIESSIIDSLRKFSNRTLFQKEVLFYLAKISNEEDVLQLKKAFLELDVDNTGTLEHEEILTAFKKIGIEPNEDEIQQIWLGMDFHNDGKVNYSEFLAATLNTLKFNIEERLWSAFKYFDTDDSGQITLESCVEALKSSNITINEEELKKFFEDIKKSGKTLNFQEFKKLVL